MFIRKKFTDFIGLNAFYYWSSALCIYQKIIYIKNHGFAERNTKHT